MPKLSGLVSGLLLSPAVALLIQYQYVALILFGDEPLVLVTLLLALLLGLGLPVLLPLRQRHVLSSLALVATCIALAIGRATSQLQQPLSFTH
jgi:hypothetical protein